MPLKVEPHANGIYYISGTLEVWKDGQYHPVEIRRSTRTRNRKDAEAVKRQLEEQATERIHSNREPSPTFSQAAARYLKHGGSERYLEKVKAHLGHRRLDDITQAVLDDAAVVAYPVALPATRRRQFYAPAIAVLRANDVHRVFRRPPDSGKRTYFFTPQQAAAMVERIKATRFPNPWNAAFATFLFGQGSRVGETLKLDGRDVNLDAGYAILRDTKNGLERRLTLCRRVTAALSTVPNLGHQGPLFLRYDGRPYAEREVRGYKLVFWQRAVKEIGLDPQNYTPHTARHSWATWHYAQNKDVMRLKEQGGWESEEWTRYTKLATAQLGKDAIKLGFDFREKNEPGTSFAAFSRK
ncbi:MAG: integrase [Mesorhizobium amorphae]|nr:MAG: integrase [Mesorhizobium amorphae]